MAGFLIVARSGRALAVSAHQAGYEVHVMDCFADEDTKAVSSSIHQLRYHCQGFAKTELIEQVKDLISCYPETILVVGAGFEKAPALLDDLMEIIPVLSNKKNVINNLKDPITLYDMLRRDSIKTPEISLTQPDNFDGWLLKEIAGIGGAHVKWLSTINSNTESCYYQKHVPGIALSAVFLARETHAILVGINEQLLSEQFSEMPFLYKGVVNLNSVEEKHSQNVIEIINKITKQTGLKGLCGIDYVVTESGEVVVIEVNPRPPSSFELHEHQYALFDAHLACFEDKEIDYQFSQENSSKGYAIYYAKQNIQINNNIVWPSWVKDRPVAGSVIVEKFPVCTVHAEGESTTRVKAVLQEQLNYIETMIMAEQHAA
ncbi:MAG: hypothetical protein DHS20C09_05780 [marine bacterium B5-7]|nr:MAG: hypothetical protein DHS20C09_05780 [marine bacterium B5-7]